MIVVLAAIALASASSRPLEVYRDWIVGCDNNLDCKAVSLQPDQTAEITPVADGALLVSVLRSPDPNSPFVVRIRARDRDRVIKVLSLDGAPIDMTGQAGHFVVEFSGPAARAIVVKLAGGKILSAADRKGAHIGSASMAGIMGALQYIERAQDLKQENAVAAPLILPPRSKAKPATLPAPDLARRNRNDPCLLDTIMQTDAVPRYVPPPQYVRLDRDATLLVMHDSCRGDNADSRLLLLDNRGRARRLPFEPAVANLDLDFDHDSETSLPNVWWDEGNRQLWTHYIARRAGDCGEQSAYVWAEGRFVMVYHAQMPVCRGTPDFIVTFHREVVLQEPHVRRQNIWRNSWRKLGSGPIDLR